MSRDDLPESGDSAEAAPTLPLVGSSFQSNLAETHGEESNPTVDLETGERADSASARVEKLARQQGDARYVLKGEVGRGGMGAVLKVFDTDLRRSFALTVILGKGGSGSRETPEVEPQQLARPEHPLAANGSRFTPSNRRSEAAP